jgi:hypothetical protein
MLVSLLTVFYTVFTVFDARAWCAGRRYLRSHAIGVSWRTCTAPCLRNSGDGVSRMTIKALIKVSMKVLTET